MFDQFERKALPQFSPQSTHPKTSSRVFNNNFRFIKHKQTISSRLDHQAQTQTNESQNNHIDHSQNSLYNTIQRKNPFYRSLFSQNNNRKNLFYNYVPDNNVLAQKPQDIFTDQKIKITLHRQTNPFHTSMLNKFWRHTNSENKYSEDIGQKVYSVEDNRVRSIGTGTQATKLSSRSKRTRTHSAHQQQNVDRFPSPRKLDYNLLYKLNKDSNNLKELTDNQLQLTERYQDRRTSTDRNLQLQVNLVREVSRNLRLRTQPQLLQNKSVPNQINIISLSQIAEQFLKNSPSQINSPSQKNSPSKKPRQPSKLKTPKYAFSAKQFTQIN